MYKPLLRVRIMRELVIIRPLKLVVASTLLGVASFCSGQTGGNDTSQLNEVWLSSLDVSRIEQGCGEARRDRTVDGRWMSVAGRRRHVVVLVRIIPKK
jgi:hypothetical protein